MRSIYIVLPDGTALNTRCKNVSSAITFALSRCRLPSVAGTKLFRDGVQFGVITANGLGWEAV